jgi:hypothetical protein
LKLRSLSRYCYPLDRASLSVGLYELNLVLGACSA